MSEVTDVAKQTPIERATTILDYDLNRLDEIIARHHKHFDALVLAIKTFGNYPGASFALNSWEAAVVIYVRDINETLKHIHHTMRKLGWRPINKFDRTHLTWDWREGSMPTDSPVIRFSLFLTENAICRKVQIGVEEVPVYEIQCEDNGQSVDIEEPDDD